MKRNALSTSLKDRNLVTSWGMKEPNSSKVGCNKQKVREPWDCNNQGYEQDYTDGFAWPPKSYTCSFCMREFRSAQALGGHMNVHRRDRARLRQSPPPPPPRNNHHYTLPNHNPNPNFPSSSAAFLPTFPSRNHKSFPSALSTLVSPAFSPSSRLSSASSIEMQKWVSVDAIGLNYFSPKTPESTFYQDNQKSLAFTSKDGSKILKQTEIIRLDLEIGLLDDSKGDLDLELRLGSFYINK